MYNQTQILKPFYNVGAEPQKATDDPGGGEGRAGTVYCVKRVENESVIVFMPVPVVWMPACCVDRLGRLG